MTLTFVSADTRSGARMQRFAQVVRRTFDAAGAVVERIDDDEEWQVWCEGVAQRPVDRAERAATKIFESAEGAERWASQASTDLPEGDIPAEVGAVEAWMAVIRRTSSESASRRSWAVWVLGEEADGWGREELELLEGMVEEWSNSEMRARKVKRLEIATENMHDLVALHELDGRYRWVSPSFERVLGYEQEELVGRDPYELFHPEDERRIREESHEPILEDEERRRTEYRIQAKGGAWVWFETLTHRITDESGELTGLQTTSRDVTRRKRYEQQISSFFSMTPAPLAMGAPQRFPERVNPAFERMFGRAAEGIEAGTPWDLVHPEDLEKAKRAYERVGGGETVDDLLIRCRHADGSWRWVEWRATLDEAAGVMYAAARDITRRTRARKQLQETNERLRALIETSPLAIATIDRDWRVTTWNRAAERTFGWSEDEVLGREVGSFLVPREKRPMFQERLSRSFDGEAVTQEETRRRTKEGETIDVWLSTAPVRGSDGTVREVMGLLEDITERKEQRRALEASEKRFRGLFEEAGVGVAIVGSDWVIHEVNPAMAEMFGYARQEMAGRHVSELSVDDATLERDRREHEKLMDGQQSSYQLERRYVRKDGELFWGNLTVSLVRDENGEPAYVLGMIEDITDRKKVEQELVYRASHDALTGLLNRGSFERELRRMIAEARGDDAGGDAVFYSVIFLDLDEFKVVNDSLGHKAGDELLKKVAGRIGEALREDDVVARLGGDEFAVLLPGVGQRERVEEIASRLEEAIREPVSLRGHDFYPSASLGIVIGSDEYAEPSELLRDADAAMYQAKGASRGGWEIFNRSMQTRVTEMVCLEEELRAGLERGEIVAYLQPIVGLEDGRAVGFEALARWKHPERGVLRPEVFLGVADRAGLLPTIDHVILEQVCQTLGEWAGLESEKAGFVSVNCSGRHFIQEHYLQETQEILEAAETGAWDVTLEVTESLLLEGNERIEATVDLLGRLEARVCIDDFGTGYSSLSMLHRLPIDALKVDKSFIASIASEDEEHPLLASIQAMAENLKIEAIAEGVERREQAEWLRGAGYGLAQGYLFGRPRPIGTIEEELFGERDGLAT